MLIIRLSRKGRRNFPMYRLLVAENSMPTDGKFVEIVGHYNPTDLNQPLVVNKERVEYWLSQGVKPTNSVAKLLNKQGFNLPVEQKHKAPKKKPDKPVEGVGEAVSTAAATEESAPQAGDEAVTAETPSVEEISESKEETPAATETAEISTNEKTE